MKNRDVLTVSRVSNLPLCTKYLISNEIRNCCAKSTLHGQIMASLIALHISEGKAISLIKADHGEKIICGCALGSLVLKWFVFLLIV